VTLQRYALRNDDIIPGMHKDRDGGWVDADDAQEEIDRLGKQVAALKRDLAYARGESPTTTANPLHATVDSEIEKLRCNSPEVMSAFSATNGDELLSLKMAVVWLAQSNASISRTLHELLTLSAGYKPTPP